MGKFCARQRMKAFISMNEAGVTTEILSIPIQHTLIPGLTYNLYEYKSQIMFKIEQQTLNKSTDNQQSGNSSKRMYCTLYSVEKGKLFSETRS